MSLHRRIAALESGRQFTESPDAGDRELIHSIVGACLPTDPRAATSPNQALALAEQIEAGRIDGLPPEVAAQPEKAAAIARRVAHFLTIV